VPVYRLGPDLAFPPAGAAEESGLLAVGGDLAPGRLLRAYGEGIFPWFEEPPILWFSPDPRTVLVPTRLRVSRRLGRTLRQGRFSLSLDRDFSAVIRACATVPRRDGQGTWITPEMIEAYEDLHRLGFAHSAEARLAEAVEGQTESGGRLVGGVYGVSLGGAFFGESMFFRERDASKAALVALTWQLEAWGFDMLDCQMRTEHLARQGAEDWTRDRFLSVLSETLTLPTRRGPWTLDGGLLEEKLRDRGG